MSRHYTWRSDSAIRLALQSSTDGVLAVDEPSDDGDDYEEEQTGSDSESDENVELGLPEEPDSRAESKPQAESAQIQEECPTAKKRKTTDRHGESSPLESSLGVAMEKNENKWHATRRDDSQPPLKLETDRSPAPIGEAKDVGTPVEAWKLLVNPSIMEKIKIYTNQEIHRHRESVETETILDSTYIDVESQELDAFVGLMYFSGLQKTSKTNLEDLWSNEYGSTLYRSVMPLKRFKFLSRMLRFDDKKTRPERRLKNDKIFPIREIWNEFVTNCTKYYNPSVACTVDEQILNFRGKCPFKVYDRTKPDNYGLKIIMLNDTRTYYMITAEPYTGKIMENDVEPASHNYLRKLSKSIRGTNRHLICKDSFVSTDLFDEMLEKYSLTTIGKLRGSEKQIPMDFEDASTIGQAMYTFDPTKTFIWYTMKRKKVMALVSTLHRQADVDGGTGIPRIINSYNAAKESVRKFDTMCNEYTTARKTLRWPMRIWMGMLDQAAINSMIIYNLNSSNVMLNRRDFFKQLIMALVEPHLRARLEFPRLRRDLRLSIQAILKIDGEIVLPKPGAIYKGRARCAFCPRSQDRKVRVFCDACRRAVCENHKTTSCTNCFARS